MPREIAIGLLSQRVTRGERCSMLDALQAIGESGDTPDLLVCAGYTVREPDELQAVAEAFKRGSTLIVAECNDRAKKSVGSLHWVYKGTVVDLGRQEMFRPFDGEEYAGEAVRAWQKRVDRNPTAAFTLLWINCGEIFVFRAGTDEVAMRHASTEVTASKAIGTADIVLHPTHSRMARGFIVERVAEALLAKGVDEIDSRRVKAFLHVSNWRTAKNQRRNLPALHKIFANRKTELTEQALQSCPGDRYLYSRATIVLNG